MIFSLGVRNFVCLRMLDALHPDQLRTKVETLFAQKFEQATLLLAAVQFRLDAGDPDVSESSLAEMRTEINFSRELYTPDALCDALLAFYEYHKPQVRSAIFIRHFLSCRCRLSTAVNICDKKWMLVVLLCLKGAKAHCWTRSTVSTPT